METDSPAQGDDFAGPIDEIVFAKAVNFAQPFTDLHRETVRIQLTS
jgi:hypothetical protein